MSDTSSFPPGPPPGPAAPGWGGPPDQRNLGQPGGYPAPQTGPQPPQAAPQQFQQPTQPFPQPQAPQPQQPGAPEAAWTGQQGWSNGTVPAAPSRTALVGVGGVVGVVLVALAQLLPSGGQVFLLNNVPWGLFGVLCAAAVTIGLFVARSALVRSLTQVAAAGLGLYWVLIIVPAIYSNGWASLAATLGTAVTVGAVWLSAKDPR